MPVLPWFRAHDLADIEACKQRWLDEGLSVLQVDHGFCVSIYTNDPNGILVEFCLTTRRLDETDKAEALRLLRDPSPPLETPPAAEFFEPKRKP